MRPYYRIALLVVIAYAFGVVLDHHLSFDPHSWRDSMLVAAACILGGGTAASIIVAASVWAIGVDRKRPQ
jgi:hypothetical protein